MIEAIRSARWPVLSLHVTQEAFNESAELLGECRDRGLEVEIVPAARLFELSKSTEHQGLIARMGLYPYGSMATFEEQLRGAIADANPTAAMPLVVICDQIQDTFNFGAILRCCDGAGAMGVIVGERGQAEVTPHVARSSVGAVHHVPVVQTANLVSAAQSLKSLGFQIIAADGNTTDELWSAPLKRLTALVIGSEGHGISPELLAVCDQRLCIPMLGQVTSLNAAVAAGIMLFEIRRQQRLNT